jgi:ankyrin repeat protein
MEILLHAGADPNNDHLGRTPLGEACARRDCGMVRTLIRAGADKHKTTEAGSPLCIAISELFPEVVRVLLEERVNPNERDGFRATCALHLAVEKGSREIVRLLLAAGANPNSRTSPNDSILHVACKSKRLDLILTLLLAGTEIEPSIHQWLLQHRMPHLLHPQIAFASGTHSRLGSASAIQLLTGFPQLLHFITFHSLPSGLTLKKPPELP